MEAEILEPLNDRQREAVIFGDGPLLVLAGAGSGKTRVITHRIAHLCAERGVSPRNVLAVTFTNKAAGEMKERVLRLLGESTQAAQISTFHSFGATLLRREAEEIGLSRGFVIYDEGDSLATVKRALKEVGAGEAVPAEAIASRIDSAKNEGLLPDAIRVSPDDDLGEVFAAAYPVYERLLRRADAVDFGDLILLPARLFERRPDVLLKYRSRFRYLLVDEFQDTNPAQYRLLKLLCGTDRPNLCAVGDDDQAIYRWRGADVRNILSFEEDFPGTHAVRLERNYRSDSNILEAAYAVISQNVRRKAKKLWTDRGKGALLGLLYGVDERDEARAVAGALGSLAEEGVPYAQMAVFFRINAQSRAIEEVFRLSGIPYQVVRGRAFYDRAEIRDATAYLRLMVNPRSDADLLRVLNVPARGIGATTEERLVAFARGQGIPLCDALDRADEIPDANAGARTRLRELGSLLRRIGKIGREAKDAKLAVGGMMEATGLVKALLDQGSDEAADRAENLRELIGAAAEFDRMRAAEPTPDPEALAAPLPPLVAFLEHVSLIGDADDEVASGRVSLMTLHAAKGLEFDAVFLTGMEEGVFPHGRALRADDDEEMAEERRLCYVGITRARKRLFFSLAQRRYLFGEGRSNRPSRFLSEIPHELFAQGPQTPAPRSQGTGRDRIRGPREGVHVEYDEDRSLGYRVMHDRFGVGIVRGYRGEGPNAKVDVDFQGVGLKVIHARYLRPA